MPVPPVATSLQFTVDLNRRFYTAYRPIILQCYINDPDVAFVRAELFVQTTPISTFVSTGVLLNAYEMPSTPNRYFMNIMEYCRPYISSGLCPLLTFPGFAYPPSYCESARFYVEAWPVRYSSTAVGQLVDDLTSGAHSNAAVVVATNTDEQTHTSASGQYLWLDKYCIANNGTQSASHATMPLTNMPFAAFTDDPIGEILGGWNGWPAAITDPKSDNWGISVDMNDTHAPSFYYLNNKKDWHWVTVLGKTLDGVPTWAVGFQVFLPPFTSQDMQRIVMHPVSLSAFCTLHMGMPFYGIIDISGDLVSAGVQVIVQGSPSGSGTGNNNYWGFTESTGALRPRWQGVNYSDMRNGLGPCGLKDRIRLHWKNALGGYDFFNFYGTQSKNVKVSGTRYEKYNDNAVRGLQGNTELWTKRQDEYTVLSQPLNKITAIWLEELVVSTQVWMEAYIRDGSNRTRESELISVNIVPGSYSTYNSEDNMHFVEIKFTLANARTQQRG